MHNSMDLLDFWNAVLHCVHLQNFFFSVIHAPLPSPVDKVIKQFVVFCFVQPLAVFWLVMKMRKLSPVTFRYVCLFLPSLIFWVALKVETLMQYCRVYFDVAWVLTVEHLKHGFAKKLLMLRQLNFQVQVDWLTDPWLLHHLICVIVKFNFDNVGDL